MQNKVIVFSDNQNLIAESLKKIEKSLLKRGLFDFSFLSCSLYADCIAFCIDAKNNNDNTIIVCDNENVDKLVEASKTDTDNLTLIKEQAVKVEQTTTYRKMMFVPIELDIDNFLNDFLPVKEVFACSIFGKTKSFVVQKFEEIKVGVSEFNYKIITNSTFLHTVYYSKFVDENLLKEKFGESVFAVNDKSLSDCCGELLRQKSLTISVVDSLTVGKISSLISLSGYDNKTDIKNSFLLFDDNSFEDFGIEKTFLDEHGAVSKETVFVMAKNALKKCDSDVALAVSGFDCDAGRCFVAVGNKQEIHVFSSIFYGNRSERFENIVNFALFRLLKFLKEKY